MTSVFAVFFAVPGIFLTYLGIERIVKTSSLVRKGTKVLATVVDIRVVDMNDSPGYIPIFSFETEQGKTFKVDGPNRHQQSYYKLNATFELLYDPMAPQKAKENSLKGLFEGPALMLLLGVILIIVGTVIGESHEIKYGGEGPAIVEASNTPFLHKVSLHPFCEIPRNKLHLAIQMYNIQDEASF